ncbi:MAG TPA: hypothetical protein VK978_00250 [Candidatus Saccharimonadales bacterium]|nr:hypothetical protein [Candidatus Saccharimonadales bacterium]
MVVMWMLRVLFFLNGTLAYIVYALTGIPGWFQWCLLCFIGLAVLSLFGHRSVVWILLAIVGIYLLLTTQPAMVMP